MPPVEWWKQPQTPQQAPKGLSTPLKPDTSTGRKKQEKGKRKSAVEDASASGSSDMMQKKLFGFVGKAAPAASESPAAGQQQQKDEKEQEQEQPAEEEQACVAAGTGGVGVKQAGREENLAASQTPVDQRREDEAVVISDGEEETVQARKRLRVGSDDEGYGRHDECVVLDSPGDKEVGASHPPAPAPAPLFAAAAAAAGGVAKQAAGAGGISAAAAAADVVTSTPTKDGEGTDAEEDGSCRRSARIKKIEEVKSAGPSPGEQSDDFVDESSKEEKRKKKVGSSKANLFFMSKEEKQRQKEEEEERERLREEEEKKIRAEEALMRMRDEMKRNKEEIQRLNQNKTISTLFLPKAPQSQTSPGAVSSTSDGHALPRSKYAGVVWQDVEPGMSPWPLVNHVKPLPNTGEGACGATGEELKQPVRGGLDVLANLGGGLPAPRPDAARGVAGADDGDDDVVEGIVEGQLWTTYNRVGAAKGKGGKGKEEGVISIMDVEEEEHKEDESVQLRAGAGVGPGGEDSALFELAAVSGFAKGKLLTMLEEKRRRLSEARTSGDAAIEGQSASGVGASGGVGGVQMPVLWVDRYKACKASQVCGNQGGVRELKLWLRDRLAKMQRGGGGGGGGGGSSSSQKKGKRAKKRAASDSESDFLSGSEEEEEQDKIAMALTGISGCGKTSAVYAVCKELKLNVIEINSTSRCTGKDLLDAVGEATQSSSLSRSQKEDIAEALAPPRPSKKARGEEDGSGGKTSVLLFDEVDQVEERGFLSALSQLILQTQIPIIMTCNSVPPQLVSEHMRSVRFSRPSPAQVLREVQLCCIAEGRWDAPKRTIRFVEAMGCDLRRCLLGAQSMLAHQSGSSSASSCAALRQVQALAEPKEGWISLPFLSSLSLALPSVRWGALAPNEARAKGEDDDTTTCAVHSLASALDTHDTRGATLAFNNYLSFGASKVSSSLTRSPSAPRRGDVSTDADAAAGVAADADADATGSDEVNNVDKATNKVAELKKGLSLIGDVADAADSLSFCDAAQQRMLSNAKKHGVICMDGAMQGNLAYTTAHALMVAHRGSASPGFRSLEGTECAKTACKDRFVSQSKAAWDVLHPGIYSKVRESTMAVDYLPFLREVCASESVRLIAGEQRRRRFTHHLRLDKSDIACLERGVFSGQGGEPEGCVAGDGAKMQNEVEEEEEEEEEKEEAVKVAATIANGGGAGRRGGAFTFGGKDKGSEGAVGEGGHSGKIKAGGDGAKRRKGKLTQARPDSEEYDIVDVDAVDDAPPVPSSSTPLSSTSDHPPISLSASARASLPPGLRNKKFRIFVGSSPR